MSRPLAVRAGFAKDAYEALEVAQGVTYDEAAALASRRSLGESQGDLLAVIASPSEPTELEFLAQLYGEGQFWVGLRRDNLTSPWVYRSGSAVGVEYGAAGLGAGKLSITADPNHLCAFVDLRAVTMVSSACDAKRQVMVKYDLRPIRHFRGSSYYFIDEEFLDGQLRKAEAIEVAKSLWYKGQRGHLPIVTSREEGRFIVQHKSRSGGSWVDGVEFNHTAGLWKFSDDTNAPEAGQTFSAFSKANVVQELLPLFQVGQPGHKPGEECLEVDRAGGLLNDLVCGLKSNRYSSVEFQSRKLVFFKTSAFELLDAEPMGYDEARRLAAVTTLDGVVAQIVTFQAEKEALFVQDRFGSPVVWLGYERQEDGYVWAARTTFAGRRIWPSGTGFRSFFNDGPGEGGDCLVGSPLRWVSSDCSARRRVLVRYDLRPIVHHGMSAFELRTATVSTHSEADKAAKQSYYRGMQGRLVSLESREEEEFLVRHLAERVAPGPAWLGGQRVGGAWRWQRTNREFWSSSGSATDQYSNWDLQQPSVEPRCMTLTTSGSWRATDCAAEAYLVVEYEDRAVREWKGATYHLLPTRDVTFADASVLVAGAELVDGVEGVLLQGSSMAELEFIAKEFPSVGSVWIGSRRGSQPEQWAWIGGVSAGLVHWDDGSAENGFPGLWGPGQPSTGDCAALNVSNGGAAFGWESKRCGKTAQVIVVFQRRRVLTFQGNKYEVLPMHVPFQVAQAMAKQRVLDGVRGRLLEEVTEDTSNFLGREFGGQVWLGASDAAQESVWTWSETGKTFWNGLCRGAMANHTSLFRPAEPDDAAQDTCTAWRSNHQVDGGKLLATKSLPKEECCAECTKNADCTAVTWIQEVETCNLVTLKYGWTFNGDPLGRIALSLSAGDGVDIDENVGRCHQACCDHIECVAFNFHEETGCLIMKGINGQPEPYGGTMSEYFQSDGKRYLTRGFGIVQRYNVARDAGECKFWAGVGDVTPKQGVDFAGMWGFSSMEQTVPDRSHCMQVDGDGQWFDTPCFSRGLAVVSFDNESPSTGEPPKDSTVCEPSELGDVQFNVTSKGQRMVRIP